MTMSLAGPGLTTTNTKKRKAKSFTKHDHAAAVAHDKWLRKMGTHPDQLKARKKKPVNTLPFERDRSHERQGNAAGQSRTALDRIFLGKSGEFRQSAADVDEKARAGHAAQGREGVDEASQRWQASVAGQ